MVVEIAEFASGEKVMPKFGAWAAAEAAVTARVIIADVFKILQALEGDRDLLGVNVLKGENESRGAEDCADSGSVTG